MESERYVVCNADEGEPGTFKDRVLLNSFVHQVFEGMTLCAAIVGSKQGNASQPEAVRINRVNSDDVVVPALIVEDTRRQTAFAQERAQRV